jgi:hypothetical protein
MNIGVRYGRRTAAATLASIGLLIVTGPMHVGNPMIPGAAYADTIRSVANTCDWLSLGWDQLSDAEKQAFQTLGWSQANWGSNNEPASSLKDWSKLTPDERNAAQALGFNEQNWQVGCPSH